MKIFAVLLVSSVALCLAASDKKVEKNIEKNQQKRGLFGLHEYQHAAPLLQSAAPFIPSPQLISTNGFVPSELTHSGPIVTEARALPLAPAFSHEAHYAHGYAHAYAAEHLHAAPLAPTFHAAAPALHAAPLAPTFHAAAPALHAAPLAPALHAASYAPAFHSAAPLTHALPLAAEAHHVPTQVNEIIKNVHVPYERITHIDNPVHVPFERIQHIDNPVPVLKYVKQSYPVHIDEPVQVPHVKEVHVPAPYIQKVPVVIQRVVKEFNFAPQHQQVLFAPQQQQQQVLFAPQQQQQVLFAPQHAALHAAPQPTFLAAAPQPGW